jgi:NAD(P)-dependent dehydrogenase (short-subunit alcohol dehydrogenase family)
MQIAIVTGVSRGLGESIAAALLARGFHVLGVGRKSSARLTGERYRFVAQDLGELSAIDATLAERFDELARAQPAAACLVNNAAVPGPAGMAGRLATADIAHALAVNLAAPAALANLFCRAFAQAGGDRRIVNVSSGAAHSVLPGSAMYCVAKAGLEMLSRSLAAEQGDGGIRVVSLRPGIIDTDMQLFQRSQPEDVLPTVGMFKDFYTSGRLVAPDVAASRIVDKVIVGPVEQGRQYSYADL